MTGFKGSIPIQSSLEIYKKFRQNFENERKTFLDACHFILSNTYGCDMSQQAQDTVEINCIKYSKIYKSKKNMSGRSTEF